LSTHFITFGAGNSRYRRAAHRVAAQARDTGLFAAAEAITEGELRRHHGAFVEQNASMLRREVRGFGYWIWKPYLIGAALKSPAADFLVYVDAGSVLNLDRPAARRRFDEYLALAEVHGLFAMQGLYDEQDWCKTDTMERTGLRGDGRASRQVEACLLVIKNSSTTRDFVRTWLHVCCDEGYRYLDDSPSVQPNAAGFKEHRHDQAILSCLVKVGGIPAIPNESYFANEWSTAGADFPIWAARHRWGSRFSPTGKDSLSLRTEERVDRVENWMASRRAFSSHSDTILDQGVFADGWATTRVIRTVESTGKTLIVRGSLPGEYPSLQDQRLTVWCDDELLGRRKLEPGPFTWELDLPEQSGVCKRQIRIRATRSFVPKLVGINMDARRLAYYLDEVIVTDTGGTRRQGPAQSQ